MRREHFVRKEDRGFDAISFVRPLLFSALSSCPFSSFLEVEGEQGLKQAMTEAERGTRVGPFKPRAHRGTASP